MLVQLVKFLTLKSKLSSSILNTGSGKEIQVKEGSAIIKLSLIMELAQILVNT